MLTTTTSAEQVNQVLSGLRYGGRLVTVGITGPLHFDDMTTLLFKQCSIKGAPTTTAATWSRCST